MKNATQTVSVIVPAYNAERFIERTLDRVRVQTRPPNEIVVVDDGSKDRTAKLVQQWSQTHSVNLKLIQKANGGASSARNVAIESASSDMIATLDADDLISSDHIEVLSRAFEMEPELVLCFGDASVHDESGLRRPSFLDGSEIAAMDYVENQGLRIIQGSAYSGLVCGSRIPTSSTMFRRAAAIEAGLYDETQKQCNDTEFLLRLSRIGKFGYFYQVINQHQRHGTNLTHPRHRVENRRFRLCMLRKTLKKSGSLELTADEISKTHKAINKAATSMLGNAADRGLATYVRVSLELITSGLMHPIIYPKQFFRAALRFRGSGE